MESQKSNTLDEIDLGQLFARIGNFFSNIGLGILRFLSLVRRIPVENKGLFTIIIVVSLALGTSYHTFRKKVYETTMILSSDYLNKRLVDNSIEKLNLLANEKSKNGLAKTLGISDTLAKNIAKFSAKPFVDEKDLIELEVLKEQLKNAQSETKNTKVIDQVIQRIEIENRHSFEITIQAYKPGVIHSLQDAIVNFFKNNDYISKRIKITKDNRIDKKTKLQHDLQKLDSLKFIIFDNYKSMAAQSRQGSNNVILSDKAVTDPIQIYNQDLELYNQYQAVNAQIYVQPDFEVVDGFTELTEPTSAGLVLTLAIALLAGIVGSYVVVAFRVFNNYLASLS